MEIMFSKILKPNPLPFLHLFRNLSNADNFFARKIIPYLPEKYFNK